MKFLNDLVYDDMASLYICNSQSGKGKPDNDYSFEVHGIELIPKEEIPGKFDVIFLNREYLEINLDTNPFESDTKTLSNKNTLDEIIRPLIPFWGEIPTKIECHELTPQKLGPTQKYLLNVEGYLENEANQTE